jgi:hypothetical protein
MISGLLTRNRLPAMFATSRPFFPLTAHEPLPLGPPLACSAEHSQIAAKPIASITAMLVIR